MDRLPNELLHMILGFLDNEMWYNFRLVSVRTYGLPTERDIMKRVNEAFADYKKLKELKSDLKSQKSYYAFTECCECERYIVYFWKDEAEHCFSCMDRDMESTMVCEICIAKFRKNPILGVNCLHCINPECYEEDEYVCPKCIVYYELHAHDFYCVDCC